MPILVAYASSKEQRRQLEGMVHYADFNTAFLNKCHRVCIFVNGTWLLRLCSLDCMNTLCATWLFPVICCSSAIVPTHRWVTQVSRFGLIQLVQCCCRRPAPGRPAPSTEIPRLARHSSFRAAPSTGNVSSHPGQPFTAARCLGQVASSLYKC